MKICMIITAAGMSMRQKQNKLLIRTCHETVIEKTISIFSNLDVDIFVIVGYQKFEMIPMLEHRFGNEITIVENEEYKNGIASSIKAGLSAANEFYDYYGFCNGDKPFIKSTTVEKLLFYIQENKPKILIPIFQERPGHPTFFKQEFLFSFYNLKGDTGGKKIIDKFPNSVTYLPVDDEGIILDMDKYLAK